MGPGLVSNLEPRRPVVGAEPGRRSAQRGTRAHPAGLRLGGPRLHLRSVVRRRHIRDQRAKSEVRELERADVVLVYPQRAPARGRHWIMPSLGLMYLSAALRHAGYSVRHIDHTFLERSEVLAEIERLRPSVIGIYCMITMQDEALSLARQVRDKALTVVGGPYPSGEPDTFVEEFDLVAVGEGEETIVQVMQHIDDRRFDEISELGYDHIWMSDDLFTLNYKRTFELAEAIEKEQLPLTWECLSRVTHVDRALFEQMHRAGCKRIFFGIESGDANVLKEMKKGITPEQARAAVDACVAAGIKAAGFFMVGYLGETTDSLIRSINFSSSLPLDYVSYTIAYPLPGTGFYERVRERRRRGEWHKVRHNRLLFNTDFSENKLRAAILKGAVQHRLNKMHLRPAARAFELATNPLLRVLR